MDCTKHQIHQEFGEDCPECIQEEQAIEDDAMGQAMDMLTERSRCECLDPGCPACKGKCLEDSGGRYYRIDMQDQTGVEFCDSCADDAIDSGVFGLDTVVKSDCSGCPLYQAKQHKSDTVSVELTRAELDWLRVAAVCSPWSGAEDLALGNQVYEKLKRSSK